MTKKVKKSVSVKTTVKKGKKVAEKTINLTGKEEEKQSLVLKKKKSKKIISKTDIKKLNERMVKRREVKVEKVKVGKEPVKKGKKKSQPKAKYELSIDVKDLLKAGCHLGHKKSKTHPKTKDNIYMIRNGVAVFDLPNSIKLLDRACNFVYSEVKKGKKIAMVGTKRQAKEVVKRVASELGLPYVTARWLGGTVSNWDQIKKNIEKLNGYKEGMKEGKFDKNTKKERSMMRKDMVRLERMVGGLAGLDKLFDVLFVVDAGFEKTAVREARAKGIPVVAIVDSDTDPRVVDWPIPLNDDNVKSVSIVVEEIGKAVKSYESKRKNRKS